MSTKNIIIVLCIGFVLFTLGLGIGYLVAREANPTPIIIQKNSTN